jgi:hypothetical protein
MEIAMLLYIAAVLLVLVGLFHTVLGGRKLIAPIVRMDGLPKILGSVEMSRITLRAGWHLLTLFWFGLAAVFVGVATEPSALPPLFYGVFAAVFAISGFGAIILSRGNHLSWAFFLPLSAICGWLALGL